MHLGKIAVKGNTLGRPDRSSTRSVARSVRSLSLFGLAAVALVSVSGCGNTYRPVVSAFNPVGPSAQPQKFAIVISSTGPSSPGLATFVDYSGDTVLITANIGVDPYYLVLNSGGTTGYTLNRDTTVSSFDISTSLLSSAVLQTTLLPGARPVSLLPLGTFAYIADPGRGFVGQFQGSPPTLQQELPVGVNPIYVVGATGAPRIYSISQGDGTGNGQVYTIETSNNTVQPNPITVGKGPVYGVMTADTKRAFIMNQTDGTVSVINSQTNALDTVPAGSVNPIPVGTSPLWADFAPTRNELVVANAGDGTSPGSVSVISIPLCSATALPSNPNCDLNNPVDATGFGKVLATIPVGVNPRMVGVLQDGTRAYVVNQGDLNQPCAGPSASLPAGNCTVSVINLTSNTVTTTIPIVTNPVTGSNPVANGHPNYIAVTTGTPTGKVYVTSPESDFMTVIRTDTDSVDTTIPLQGKGISVRVTVP